MDHTKLNIHTHIVMRCRLRDRDKCAIIYLASAMDVKFKFASI